MKEQVMTTQTNNTNFYRLQVIIASLVIVFAGLALTSSLFGPILFAIFIAILAFPILKWLMKRGLPKGLALLVMIIGLVIFVLTLTAFFSSSFDQLEASLSTYQAQIDVHLSDFKATLEANGFNLSDSNLLEPDTDEWLASVTAYLKRFGSLLANAILIAVTMIFALLEASNLHNRLQQNLGPDHLIVVRSEQFSQSVIRYFGLRTLVNLFVGTGVAVLLLILKIDFAVLWGVLAFFLGYIPYLGAFLATLPGVLLAWVQYDIGMAILVVIGITLINFAGENLVAPKLIGKGLNISPLVVFVAFMLWSAVLGPLGMFLSMPLTVIMLFLLDSFPETRWLAGVMGASQERETISE
jgi:predicted PurR-regulated permease PerM